MSLSSSQAAALLATHTHGVLGTLHPERGVDMTPCVYVCHDGYVGSPVDLVKLKSSLRLQRERNLEGDTRATLLVEHWDRHDWSKLWWVRAELSWVGEDGGEVAESLAERLAEAFDQYRDRPFAAVLVFEVLRTTGWSATGRMPAPA